MGRSQTALVLALCSLLFLGVSGAVGCRHPAPPAEEADKLTVGKVQGEIKVGMAASSVAQVLGSPNIVTTDEQRRR